MLALMGSKNRGAGKYQDYLPSLPVPPLKATLRKYAPLNIADIQPFLSCICTYNYTSSVYNQCALCKP